MTPGQFKTLLLKALAAPDVQSRVLAALESATDAERARVLDKLLPIRPRAAMEKRLLHLSSLLAPQTPSATEAAEARWRAAFDDWEHRIGLLRLLGRRIPRAPLPGGMCLTTRTEALCREAEAIAAFNAIVPPDAPTTAARPAARPRRRHSPAKPRPASSGPRR